MTLLAAEGKRDRHRERSVEPVHRTERGAEPARPPERSAEPACPPERSAEPPTWKKKVSETLHALRIIPERFNGKVVVTFKDGGISYLEKTETMK